MPELKILGVDRLKDELIVALSNGETFRVTLEQLLSLDPLPEAEDEWDQTPEES